MKKGQHIYKFLLIICLALAIPAMSAVTFVADTVADSATGNWLNGVKVTYSAACTTTTDASGLFSIIIPGTEINFSITPKTKIVIFYNPANNYFSAGEEKINVEVFNVKGDLMTGDKLSPGNYFAICKLGAFRFLNIAGGRQSFVFGTGTASGTTNGLAKISATTSVVLSFSKSGYNSKSLTLNVSPGINPRVKLSAIPPAGSSATINIGITPIDTLKGVATIP
jgi:hypothetical protein